MSFQVKLVKRLILNYLLNGNYAEGAKLPTVRKFSKAFRVSPARVQEAIHTLAEEGVIRSVPRQGLFVQSLKPQAVSGHRIGLVFPGPKEYLARIPESPYPAELIEGLERLLKLAGDEMVYCPMAELDTLSILDQ